MTWLVWRQYRWQAAIAAVLLAAFATALIVTGLQMASQWHSLLTTCATSSACGTVSLGSTVGHDLVVLSLAVPAILGFLWGAPLVAHELETGTVNFAWAQSITKARWLTVKAGWLLLAAAVWGGAVAALVTWWSGPRNAFYSNQFQPNYFDQQGIVPIGYAVFATALGIAAGTVCRRTLVAIAVTIGGFIGARLVISQFLRAHYMAAVTAYYNPLSSFSPSGSAWVLSTGVVDKYGHVFTGGSAPEVNGVPITAIPASCRGLLFRDPTTLSRAQVHQAASCMQTSGFRGFTTYQPAYHYWPFQGIETGIYLALAAILLAVTFFVVRYRDA
jgi:ABC-type transport system involved in multi-copper enzyme maturation permease subunit